MTPPLHQPVRRSSPGVAYHVAAAVAAVSVAVLGVGGAPRAVRAAPAKTEKVEGTDKVKAAKSLRYDGKQELDGAEKALSLTLTGGAFAALAVIAFRKNREDDALEMVRIKAEVERLEKLKAEFENVDEDEDGLDDDEFMADLKKRMAQDAEAGEGDEGDETEGDGDIAGVAVKGKDDDDDDGGSEGGDDGTEEGGDDASGASDIEALRRMWAADSPNGDKKGEDDSKPE